MMGFFSNYLSFRIKQEAAEFLIDSAKSKLSEISDNISISNAERDRTTLLKMLCFVVSYKHEITKEHKKEIIKIMKITDDSISLFAKEPEIDAICKSIKEKNFQIFWASLFDSSCSREKQLNMYQFVLTLIFNLHDTKLLSEKILYNLFLLKQKFNFSREELGLCYHQISSTLGEDVDDVAEVIETFTSPEIINKFIEEDPEATKTEKKLLENTTLIVDENFLKKYPNLSRETLTKITEEYNQCIREINDKKFSKYVKLAKDDSKLLEKILNSFAEKARNEIPILMYNDSLFGLTKEGILLTDKNLYINDKCISLKNIIDIKEHKLLGNKTLRVNSHFLEITCSNISDYIAAFALLLSSVIDILKENPNFKDSFKPYEIECYKILKEANNPELYTKCIFPDDNSSYIYSAIKSYVKESIGENAIFQFCSPFLEGNNGILITDKRIYCSSYKKKFVNIKDITNIALDAKTKEIAVNDMTICEDKKYAKYLYEIIRVIIDFIKK